MNEDRRFGRVRRGDVRTIASEILDDYDLDPEGGVLAVVVAPKAPADELAAQLAAQRPHVRVALHDGPLTELNAQRDNLLIHGAITLIRISELDAVGELLVAAPDLNDWLESINIIEAAPSTHDLDPADTAQYLAKIGEACAQLDLTGLVPGFHQQWRLPLDSLYMDLAPDDLPLSEQARLQIFVGHPGTGKTTFLRHRVVELARCALVAIASNTPHEVPILVPATAYAKALSRRIRPFAEFLGEELEALGYRGGRALLHAATTRSCACVCIDALDEVPADLLRGVVDGIVAFADSTQARILITSRPAHLVAVERPLQAFSRSILRSPEPAQIDSFIDAFFEAHAHATGSSRTQSQAEGLKARLRQPDLARLTATPLTLTFLALLHVVEGHLPERRVSLYHRLSELLVERWNTARSLAGPRDSIPYGEALRIFAPLAWWMLRERPSGFIKESDLIRQLTNQLVERGEDAGAASRLTREFLDRMRRDMSLLLPTDHGYWYFFHPTIAEYLAGVELSRNHKLRHSIIQKKALFDPPLREMLLFCAGELGVIRADDESLHDLISAALNQSSRAGRYDSRYASLLVGLLVEDVSLARPDEAALVRRITALALDYVYSSDERRIVGFDFFRAIGLTFSRTPSAWQKALGARFVAPLDKPSVDTLLRDTGGVLIPARLIQGLPALLESLSLTPQPLLMHLVAHPTPLARVIGWAAAATCSRAACAELLASATRPTGSSLVEQLAIRLYNVALARTHS